MLHCTSSDARGGITEAAVDSGPCFEKAVRDSIHVGSRSRPSAPLASLLHTPGETQYCQWTHK